MTDRFQQYAVVPGPLQVQDIKVMHGANYFSGGRVVVLRLDLGRYDEVFTSDIPGFYERLQEHLPSLQEHHCSVGQPGGFFQRVCRGTLLGHVTEHVAIELQTLAGMDVAYGKTRMTSRQGVYNVVFRFLDEVAGVHAGKAAVNLVNALLLDQAFDVNKIAGDLVEIREQRLLGPSTQAIVDEAERRKIPWLRLDDYNLVQLGSGKHHKRIRATVTSDTSFIGVETAGDPVLTVRMLRDAGLPCPETVHTDNLAEAVALLESSGAPVVVKPDQRGGIGAICTDLQTETALEEAFGWVRRFGDGVLVQRFVPGVSFRLLVIDYRFVAAVRMQPPTVTGDGQHTVAELIELLNSDPERGIGDKSSLTRVEVDEVTLRLISSRGFTPQSVLPAGEELALKVSGNLRCGGSAISLTDQVHPENLFLAERAARVLGLNVAGIDMIAPDLSTSILENGGQVIGVSAAPDFRPHLTPVQGPGRNVAEPMLDMLFPPEKESHIPLFSVTGHHGRAATVKLLRHALEHAGRRYGLTAEDGLCIGNSRLKPGDMTGPEQVALVVRDPTIDCAVLETPVDGILERGLGYELADFGLVLGVGTDRPLSEFGVHIEDLEDLAYATSVVAEQVRHEGFAILNADDPLVLEMRKRVGSQLVLFSSRADNPEIKAHLDDGGLAVFLDRDHLVIQVRDTRMELLQVNDLSPADGATRPDDNHPFLAAAAALYCFGMSVDTIAEALAHR